MYVTTVLVVCRMQLLCTYNTALITCWLSPGPGDNLKYACPSGTSTQAPRSISVDSCFPKAYGVVSAADLTYVDRFEANARGTFDGSIAMDGDVSSCDLTTYFFPFSATWTVVFTTPLYVAEVSMYHDARYVCVLLAVLCRLRRLFISSFSSVNVQTDADQDNHQVWVGDSIGAFGQMCGDTLTSTEAGEWKRITCDPVTDASLMVNIDLDADSRFLVCEVEIVVIRCDHTLSFIFLFFFFFLFLLFPWPCPAMCGCVVVGSHPLYCPPPSCSCAEHSYIDGEVCLPCPSASSTVFVARSACH